MHNRAKEGRTAGLCFTSPARPRARFAGKGGAQPRFCRVQEDSDGGVPEFFQHYYYSASGCKLTPTAPFLSSARFYIALSRRNLFGIYFEKNEIFLNFFKICY